MSSFSKGFSGLTDAQAELIEHWHRCRLDAGLPQRARLDPGAIRKHLSYVSMVEVEADGRTRFRLAGSELRRLFGREMRGRYLSELDETSFETWSLGLARALELRQPVGGAISRERDSHAWLRLPLRSDDGGVLVLCHDALIANTKLKPVFDSQSNRIASLERGIAA